MLNRSVSKALGEAFRARVERLRARINDEEAPALITYGPDSYIEDGGGYGGDLDTRPDFIKQEDAEDERRKGWQRW